jgi:hypothetical protein
LARLGHGKPFGLKSVGDLDENTRRKIIHDTAVRVYGLDL